MVWSFDHIFNVESMEAERRPPQLPPRWQSKPSNLAALIGALVRKVVERLPTHIRGFADLHHISPDPRLCRRIRLTNLTILILLGTPLHTPMLMGRCLGIIFPLSLCCHPNTGLQSKQVLRSVR